jgi:SlyX protein
LTDRTESRLVELESRLTEQERVIEQLNEVVIEQGLGLERLAERVRTLTESLGSSSNDASGGSSEPPPPHY